ncbi:MAG TPA: ABC transporter permease [Candidatus Acidoferrales bacterium]|nr:ABC transporter permease [Candidatus Acidoferrales bacterium]
MSSVRTKSREASVAFKETLWLALDTLRVHKLRSFLTLLGVILAVFTLVLVISTVEGMNDYVAEKIANLGAGVFGIDRFGVITSFEEWVKAQKRPPLRYEEFEGLQENMTLADSVAAVAFRRMDVRYGNELADEVQIVGVTAAFAQMRNYVAMHGRYISESDDEHHSPVCFIGPDLVTRFFPTSDPMGKTIRVGPQVYEIIGVGKPQGSVLGQSQDNYVHIPLGTFRKTFFRGTDSVRIFVQAKNPEVMNAARDEARMILRARRHLTYNDADNFAIVGSETFTTLWEELSGNIFRIAVGLTSVFMVVGGIVIMNIMLASVTERTREIGIRKSLGARRRHIVMQFLVESALMAAAGGLVGIVLAAGLGMLVTAVTSFPIVTPLWAVLVSLTMSTSVGLFFGIYPAVRAARLDPIEALRQEV